MDSDTDYSDGEFEGLLTQHKIKAEIKVFYDRIQELLNPIDRERLKLDSV